MFKFQNMKGTSYKSYYKGTWSNCRVIKVENQDVYSISMANNIECRMGRYHEQPILRDGKCITVSAQDIKVGDYIPFNNYVIDGKINASYNFGFAVGAYLGDGSKDNDGINYSLCADKVDDNITNQLTEFFESLGFKVTVSVTGKLRSLRVGAGSFNLISRFLTGTSALDKGLSKNVLSLSVDARRGILDGLIASDGDAIKKRVSTSSKTMVESVVSLASSIGVIAYLSYVDSRDNRLGSNPNYIITVVREKKNYKNKFLTVNNQLYMAVTNVDKLDSYNGGLYCLEVDNDSHLFTLANGMITHNCRLQLDLRELLKRGGGLFGSAEMTGSIGVVTINMARLGYLYKGDKDALYNRLDALMDLAKDTLEKKRKFITDLYNRGLYPFTKRYLPGFRNHFSTIGVNGMNEMLRNFSDDTMSTATEDGVKFSEDILHHIRERIRSYQEETGNLYNLEATPAEGCFAGETLVWTKGGFERIQYLLGEKNVEVYTMNEATGCIELKPVEDIFMTDIEAQVMQIKFTNGMSVVCTLLHPFAVPNRKAKESNNSIKWVEATNLTIGELVFGALVKNNDKNTVINYEEVCYEVQDIVYLDKKVPVYNMTVKGNSNYYVMDPDKEGSCLLVHNCTHRFAREDQKRFPDIIQAGYPGHRYYTNSSQLPVNYTSDLFLALKMQDKLQCCYTGGTTFHMYMSEAISSPEACRDIVRKVLTNFKMPYVTVTPLFSICEKHGYLKGQHEYCPICDQEIIDKAILEESKSAKNGAST